MIASFDDPRAQRVALVRAALMVDDTYVREAAARAVAAAAVEQWARDDALGIGRRPLRALIDALSARMRRSDLRRARTESLAERALALLGPDSGARLGTAKTTPGSAARRSAPPASERKR